MASFVEKVRRASESAQEREQLVQRARTLASQLQGMADQALVGKQTMRDSETAAEGIYEAEDFTLADQGVQQVKDDLTAVMTRLDEILAL